MTSSSFATIEAGHGPNNNYNPPAASSSNISNSSSSSSGNIPPSAHSVSTITTSTGTTTATCRNNLPTTGTTSISKTITTSTSTNASTNNSTTTTSVNSSSSLGRESSTFHAHRQNHNSSKLPAFRFADLKKDALVLPSLLQHMPPSPVSPNPAQNTADDQSLRDAHDQNQRIPGSLRIPDSLHLQSQHQRQHPKNHNNGRTTADKSISLETPPGATTTTFSHQTTPSTARTSTILATSSARLSSSNPPSIGLKRPASFPDPPNIVRNNNYATASQSSSTATPVAKRRLTTSGVAGDARTLTSTNSASSTSRLHATDPAENSTKEWAQGQRELLLPRTLDTAKPDDKKKSRPPVSYRAPSITSTAGGGRAVIPPIRAFRSSGSRKSLVLDMHTRRVSDDSFGDDITDPNHRDRTLRALEGREDDYSQVTPPDSADLPTDNENTAEIFMNIAREESAHRQPEERAMREDQSAISRITRASHRRPLSAVVPVYQTTSPPQITRRLSDQRESSRARKLPETQSAQQITRELAYRSSTRERQPPSITTTSEEPSRTQSLRTPLRPSPITPRQISFQDDVNPIFTRRRSSVTEGSVVNSATRSSQYRNANLAVGQGRTYNSSPLVPKSVDIQRNEPQQGADANHGVEGTESSASTAAPSTVWDELDDLKSRIHRLELTGKIPPTSGAAMSRASDDRPPTANTNATTMSASPKRGSGAGAVPADTTSTTSSQRESQPILLSALNKTKNLVSSEVFNAIESAATDALALSGMIGAPGQLGPISSGASTVGGGGSITDRQLRRKADSICRSLTELCIALADEVGQGRQPQPTQSTREREVLRSPKAPAPEKSKRSVTLVESTPGKLMTSPRAPTSLEQRRMTLLGTPTLSSPRFAGAPSTALDPISTGRKSSLLLARNLRAGTEELEDTPGRRSSLILRKRRAVTEEPEEIPQEGRKTSLLRTRRNMNEEDEEDSMRFRTPSRAVTEVNGIRSAPHELSLGQTSPRDTSSLESSALPRRRLVPSSLNPRLVAPSTPTSSGAAFQRRFLDRTPMADREAGGSSIAEKLSEDRGPRHISLSQTAMLNRTSSISSRRRESGIPGLSSLQLQQQQQQQQGASQNAGGPYR